MQVQLAPENRKGLLLSNPVMTASGTFGYGTEYADLTDIQGLGAIVCKGTTLRPRPGNPQPRIVETASGMLNSIGLENIGVDALVRDIAPVWSGWRVPVVVNIAGESLEEYAEIAARLDGVPGIAGIEVNISCPNVKRGGMELGTDPALAGEVTRLVKKKTALPLLVKLTPNVTDIADLARAVVAAGADALTVCNTLRGMAINIARRKPSLGNRCGGLSGPAIKPVALYLVYTVAKAVDVPIVGCGGIVGAQDALEFIMAGASAVQVGTATFLDPRAAVAVRDGIAEFMADNGIESLADLVGQAQS
ncbi:MAG: dihydroorotate dehydrogenase [Dehalococcoidia bacterium]|nr:dihydroorotate dehydrogenase [Dehalococcoidia bacterium]